jgi:hypothetical protein
MRRCSTSLGHDRIRIEAVLDLGRVLNVGRLACKGT